VCKNYLTCTKYYYCSMEISRIVFLISSPILGILSFLLLKFYNNGYGEGLYSKRWYLRCGILSILLSIICLIVYFTNPDKIFIKSIKIVERFKELKWFEIIVTGMVGYIIAKVLDYIVPKSRKTN
jgi:hypothetical protein